MQDKAAAAAAAIDNALEQADALGRNGQLPEMEQACRQLIGAFPESAYAWNRVGRMMARHGNLPVALACMEQAIHIAPQEPAFHADLGTLMRRAGQPDRAVECFSRAVALAPDDPAARLDMGDALLDAGRGSDAAAHFEHLTALHPGNAKAWHGLGRARFALRQMEAAASALAHSLALDPNDVAARVLLARARLTLNDFKGALAAGHEALGVEPDSVDAITVIVEALLLDERHAEAEQYLRAKLQAMPDSAALQYVLSRFLLEQGDYRSGFALYEARLKAPSMQRFIGEMALPMPMWTGEDLKGRRLLVITEQGYGDHIQFYRFVARLTARGAEVVLATSPPLQDLMRRQPECMNVLTQIEDAQSSGCDYYTFIGSLPHRLGITTDAITPSGSYLRASPAKQEAWRHRLSQFPPGRRIGLVWAGRPDHRNDTRRSIPFRELAPLSEVSGVTWIGIQAGGQAVDTGKPGLQVERFGEDLLASFDDSAALIAELDLLISVDTAPAHLAGALGCPVWLLLPKVADWRWSLAEEASPWYPGMRLFRQQTRDDWNGVLRDVASALQRAG